MDAAASAQKSTIHSGLVLNDVTIVDTHTGKLTAKMSLVLEDGKIAKIVPSGSIVSTAPARLIEGHGKFVVPGFWDMHAHPFNSPDLKENLSLMLANGVTGVRQMAGSPELLEKRKQGKLVPAPESPELLALPGSLLFRSNVPTPQAAVAELQKQKAQGADFIKTIDLTPEVFFASLAEAKQLGLPYEGHLSKGVSAAKASEEGMRSIEHLGAGEGLLVDCSTDEAAVRKAIEQIPIILSPADASSKAGARNLQIALAAPILASSLSDPTLLPRVQHLIDTYSEEKCRKLAEVFIAHQTWQVPTLIRLRTAAFADDAFYTENPDLHYASPAARQLWETVAERYSTLSPDAKQTLHRMFALQMKITRLFDQAGVKMLAGSDVGGSVWEIPGVSLHQEFDLLAEAGLSPLRILQMTTLNGAEFYGRQATAGSVEEGKDANLVLLEANPIESVQNLHKIHAVVRAGVYYSSDALDALKQQAAEHLASAPNPDGSPKPTH
jgi:imidazolonepropionase-like amidohydrolase